MALGYHPGQSKEKERINMSSFKFMIRKTKGCFIEKPYFIAQNVNGQQKFLCVTEYISTLLLIPGYG